MRESGKRTTQWIQLLGSDPALYVKKTYLRERQGSFSTVEEGEILFTIVTTNKQSKVYLSLPPSAGKYIKNKTLF